MGPFSIFTNIVILFVAVNLAMLIYNAINQKLREGLTTKDDNNNKEDNTPVPADPPAKKGMLVCGTTQSPKGASACDARQCNTDTCNYGLLYKYNDEDSNSYNCEGCNPACTGSFAKPSIDNRNGDFSKPCPENTYINKNNSDPGQSEKDWEEWERKHGIDTRGYSNRKRRPDKGNEVYMPIIPPYLPKTRCSDGIIDNIKRRTGKIPTSCVSVDDCKEIYSKNNEAAYCYKGDAIAKVLNNIRERSVPDGDSSYNDYTGDSGPSGAFDEDGTLDQDTKDAYNDAINDMENESPSMHGSQKYPSDTTGGEVASSATTGMMTDTRPGAIGEYWPPKDQWLPANYADYKDMKGKRKPKSYDSVWDLF